MDASHWTPTLPCPSVADALITRLPLQLNERERVAVLGDEAGEVGGA